MQEVPGLTAAAAAPPYLIIEDPKGGNAKAFQPYGGGLQIWKCKAPEVIISGPAETGKTRTCLEKLDALMWKYPGAQAIIVRKTYHSLKMTVLLTFEKKVLGPGSPVVKLGGEHREGYVYPNGSRIYLGGLDDPDKVLSSEWDVVYINQTEELTLNDWEVITTRTTGRAGNMPYAQVLGDCNPDRPTHWIRHRPSLAFFESRHEDNPVLFNPVTHEITEQGRRTLAVLDGLTGVRYQRLRLGKWAAAEGTVYEEFDRAVHLIDRFPIPDDWVKFRAIDFGYTNPFTCQWWAIDEDGRLYLYRELYMSKRLVEDHARQILEYTGTEQIYATVADHDAEDRATLAKYGIETIPAMKAVSLGIQAVQSRLRKAGDGRPRLFIMRDSLIEVDPWLQAARKPLCFEQEMDAYVWKQSADGKPNKEEPVKADDHACDAARYLVTYVDSVTEAADMTEAVLVYEDDYSISPF